MMTTRQDNDVTDHTGVFYVKNDIELLLLIGSGAIYDEYNTQLSGPIESSGDCEENQIAQWHDQSYRFDLCQKRQWAIMTDQIRCQPWWKTIRKTMWLII